MGTYQELKKANPRLPILVRECEGATAKLIARYGRAMIICSNIMCTHLPLMWLTAACHRLWT